LHEWNEHAEQANINTDHNHIFNQSREEEENKTTPCILLSTTYPYRHSSTLFAMYTPPTNPPPSFPLYHGTSGLSLGTTPVAMYKHFPPFSFAKPRSHQQSVRSSLASIKSLSAFSFLATRPQMTKRWILSTRPMKTVETHAEIDHLQKRHCFSGVWYMTLRSHCLSGVQYTTL
jgi:hypothetical protein